MAEDELVSEYRTKLLLLGVATVVFLVGVVYFLTFA